MVPVGNYQKLSMGLPGTYEYNLVKQMNLTSDDERAFTHPFLEETTKSDLLRRVVSSKEIPEWSDFIEGCYNDPNKVVNVVGEPEVVDPIVTDPETVTNPETTGEGDN